MIGRPRGTTPQQAEEELRAAGYEPLESYPGTVVSAWPVRCGECRRERRVTLNYVRKGGRCQHKRDTHRTKVSADKAEKELRAAGYRPLEPYPGNVTAGWPSQCLVCGNRRSPSLDYIRKGRRCAHRNDYTPVEGLDSDIVQRKK